jgi:hypothetical protein
MVKRPPAEPTTFVRGRTGGIIAKVQADLPLSALDRDIIIEVLRKHWLTKKEHAAFLRQAKLRAIENLKGLAKEPAVRHLDVPAVHGFPTPEALQQFVKRERRRRR